MRLRTLWDRVTGREAERARQEARECRRLLDQERRDRKADVLGMRLAALDHALVLHKQVSELVDVDAMDGLRRQTPGTVEWAAKPIDPEHVETARNILLGQDTGQTSMGGDA